MRTSFRAYYQPTSVEMKTLWRDGLLILDTNALLNLFRYSSGAREDFFKALDAKQDSLWLPHQVGREFHRNRISIINHQTKAFGELEIALGKARSSAEAALNTYKRHPSLDIGPLRVEFSDAIETLLSRLQAEKERHRTDMLASRTNDGILDVITELYNGRVGEPFDDDTLTALYGEGAERYEKSVPPGYRDASKPEPDRYGDLVLWKQILKHAATAKQPAIFVTDDQKEDWWYTVGSERHGARPELVEEYYVAAGHRIHFMTTDRFLEFAKSEISGIRTESVSELELLAREHAMNESAMERELRESVNRELWQQHVRRTHQQPSTYASDRLRRLEHDENYVVARSELERVRSHRIDAEERLRNLLNAEKEGGPSGKLNQDIIRVAELVEHLTAAEAVAASDLEIALRFFDHTDQAAAEIVANGRRTPERISDVFDTAIGAPMLDYPGAPRDPDGRTSHWRQEPLKLREYELGSDGAPR